MTLSHDEIQRYGRHLVLPEVGVAGQEKLKAARVLLVGVGGLGSPAALYLAAAGVGTLGLVDDDRVDRSNLQRQVLYGERDVGRPKVEAAAERLRDLNPNVVIEQHPERLGLENVERLVAGYDLVLDGSDNFQTRYLINDACVIAGKPLVWGAVLRFEGQVALFAVPGGPCYRCLFPQPPPAGLVPSCAEGGVFGVLPGIIGSLQANECIRWILGLGRSLLGRLVIFDALRLRFRELRLDPAEDCPICSLPPEQRRLETVAEGSVCTDISAAQPRDETHTSPQESSMFDSELPFEITVADLHTWRTGNRPHRLIDVRQVHEHDLCRIEGADLLPLHELPTRTGEVDRETLTVIYCHHGARSGKAVMYLRQQGYENVTNLRGGINAWSLEIDPSVPRY